jgi:hypothetical protein
MSWVGIANNQCVSCENLQDAVTTGVFVLKNTIPSTTPAKFKQITKTEAAFYVNLNESYAPFAAKAANQLVVKSNLQAATPATTTTTTTSFVPGTTTTTTTSFVPGTTTTTTTIFVPVTTTTTTTAPPTRYTYLRYDMNGFCVLSNPIQFWSYINIFVNGVYYINGDFSPYYYIESSSHSNFSNEITSNTPTTCVGCRTWDFYNSGDPGEPTEYWAYINCGGVPSIVSAEPREGTTACVRNGTTPSLGSLGDNAYDSGNTCA